MKALKMLGLAALAAMMAMAFVGAASAMGETTGLCGVDQTPCETLTHVHETTLAGSPATLLNSVGNVTCDVLFLGDTVAGTSAPLTISGNFTYTNCLRGSESCTVTEKNGPVSITVLKEGHETGKVTGKGEVQVKCGSFINCTYDGEGLVGTAKGPLLSTETNGSVSLSEQTTHKVSGFLCPAEGKLDITTTPLAATYIVGGLGYCVDTEHQHGYYTDNTCKTVGSPLGHSYRYALVIGPAGLKVGEIKCYKQLPLPHNGLWKDSACTEDNASNVELYEKGEIKTVE